MNALAIILAAQVASAPVTCGPAPDLMAGLKAKYGEVVKWTGSTSKGVVVLLASPSGSWSLLNMPMPGVACLVGSGKGSRELFGEPA